MSERIIGQCSTSDIRTIEGFVNAYGTSVYAPPALKRKQIFALALAAGFIHAGFSFDDLYCIKLMLLWEHHIEFRFIPSGRSQLLRHVLEDNELVKKIQDKMAEILNIAGRDKGAL